jgi:hypothetical protein
MNVLVVKVKKRGNAELLKKYIATLNEEASVLSEAEYRDSMFSKLLELGRKSKVLSTEQAQKELTKRGINL